MDELKSMVDLLDLQSVDSAIDKLLDDRANLPALAQYKTAHATALDSTVILDETKMRLRELELAVDKNEGELELAESKLEQQEQRLFAGGMSAKETEHMRLEVESLRRQKTAMEDELLELLDQRESVESEANAADQVSSEDTSTVKSLEAKIADSWKTIDAEIARKEARKAEISPEVDEDLMELYTELRVTRGGVVVGALDGRICGSCHIELSAAEHHGALQEDPPRCTHCGSILVP